MVDARRVDPVIDADGDGDGIGDVEILSGLVEGCGVIEHVSHFRHLRGQRARIVKKKEQISSMKSSKWKTLIGSQETCIQIRPLTHSLFHFQKNQGWI